MKKALWYQWARGNIYFGIDVGRSRRVIARLGGKEGCDDILS